MAIEIVELPIENGGSFETYSMLVYQSETIIKHYKSWLTIGLPQFYRSYTIVIMNSYEVFQILTLW